MPHDDKKLATLRRLFGARNVEIHADVLVADDKRFPIVDGVIITLKPEQYPAYVAAALRECQVTASNSLFAEDIQYTFGTQWQKFDDIMPEHEKEFWEYFDLVDVADLKNSIVVDLGCGMGRWSYFLAGCCQTIVLVDFSEAIFAARRALRDHSNAIFVMGDVHTLPFASDSADFAISLGVLHHMPTDALQELVRLRPIAPRLLIYLYYALENRPAYFRWLLVGMRPVRSLIAGVRNEFVRDAVIFAITLVVYVPFAGLARMLGPFGFDRYVPLHAYQGKSFRRIRQDAYDKLLTRIEQRFTRQQIEALQGRVFSRVIVSNNAPYWHFLCER